MPLPRLRGYMFSLVIVIATILPAAASILCFTLPSFSSLPSPAVAAAAGWLTPKTIMMLNMVLMALVPAYGLLGFADPVLGYRRFWELYIGA